MVCVFAAYNSASPRARRRGMGFSQGGCQTLPSLLLLHSQIIATHEQNDSRVSPQCCSHMYIACTDYLHCNPGFMAHNHRYQQSCRAVGKFEQG